MKTILEINTTNYSSTGNIMLNIAKTARNNGYQVYTCCKNSKSSQRFDIENHFLIGSRIDRAISEKLQFYTGFRTYFNIINTYWLINKIKKINPDLIHIHAIGECFLNMKIFFNYLKKTNKPVIWTLHDGWPLTGYCAFFMLANCTKWKEKCHNCPLMKFEKASFYFDRSSLIQIRKRKCFSNMRNLTIVTPSKWLASNVNESYLNQYPVKVINNGINLNKFQYRDSDLKNRLKIEDKHIVLGVTFMWNKRKGIDDMIKLSKDLPSNYQVILVGHIDKDMQVPSNIIHIEKTYDQIELSEYYSISDVFVNPTYEDNFPTVNMEALACGTPVLTYNTGGSPEIIDSKTGYVVEKGDYASLLKETIKICKYKTYSRENCIKRSKCYDMNNKFKEYIKLYNELLTS